jgi:hypothetical protein
MDHLPAGTNGRSGKLLERHLLLLSISSRSRCVALLSKTPVVPDSTIPYSSTEKQHTTPPASLSFRALTDAALFAASSVLTPGVSAPLDEGVVLPEAEGEGAAESEIPAGGARSVAAREEWTCWTGVVAWRDLLPLVERFLG